MLARSKLNSIEGKVSEALINNEISHEDFMIIINEKKKYRELKKSIRMMNSQGSDSESINPKVLETANGKTMMLSKCAMCISKNQNLLKSNKQKDY